MNTKAHLRPLLAVGALAVLSATWGCVADRPSRNGVFDENQYLRKDWLIRPGDSNQPDHGWFLKATITDASEPNVFGDADTYGLYPGSHNQGQIVHFTVTSDKMQMVNSREINSDPTVGKNPEVINAWPVTNVDLKYKINLDGEKTNLYEENQELDWQLRQWVKVNLDKNDMSDLAPLGDWYGENLAKCADVGNASATLVPGSFVVDEKHDYMQWSVQVTLPIKWGDASCVETFGAQGDAAQRLGREYETVTLKYSMVRADPNVTYRPLSLAEKDKIRRKYGPFTYATVNRDPTTGNLASTEYVVRYDPDKEIKWYFERGFPDRYKNIFTSKNLPAGVQPVAAPARTIEDATNELLADAGAAARVSFHEYDEPMEDGTPIEREFGDVRYNMIRWIQSLDQTSSFAGVTEALVDPRNGQILSTDIVLANFAIKDYYVERIDAYLQTIGASNDVNQAWGANPTIPDPNDPTKTIEVTCDAEGKTAPIVPKTALASHNGNSTLFQKIQQYLYKPATEFGPLGPQDFIKAQDDDFFSAYYAYIPYLVYGDPEMNAFVRPEGGAGTHGTNSKYWQLIDTERQFHDAAALIDRGLAPVQVTSPSGEQDLLNFVNKYKAYSLNHRDLVYTKQALRRMPGLGFAIGGYDQITDFAMESVMAKDARHCVKGADGSLHWESKDEWVDSLIQTYWSQVAWHEFGHSLGLEHNFMASVDKPNFPVAVDSSGKPLKNSDGTTRYGLYASSVMEYNAAADRVFWQAAWAPYDRGAITWIYSNYGTTPVLPEETANKSKGVSGQLSPTVPWNDKNGWTPDGKSEINLLFCSHEHTRYTPLCRAGDIGTTPSEITANDIDTYEWKYKWRNFRLYRKIWDDSKYADEPLQFVTELRRFLSMWAFDMSSGEITAGLSRVGVQPPKDAPSAQLYYAQLTDKFTDEMSHAGQLAAAFHEAIIQQSSGQRPYISVYDDYYGDVTQQGISLDKLDALTSWLAVWPIDNYDLNQSEGRYIASYSPFGLADNLNGTAIGAAYQTVAEQSVASMIGAAYDSFPYFKPLGVGLFSQDTHSFDFAGANVAGAYRVEVRDWAGGYVFDRPDDFLAFFRDIAVKNNFQRPQYGIDCTTDVAHCAYDPRTARAYPQDTFYSDQYNEFLAPNGRRYIWVWLQDRNQWVVADRDRNVGTYQIMRTYTTTVLVQKADGNGDKAFQYELEVKYFIDYFKAATSYEGSTGGG